ncbi:hypothetical protein QF117_11260 [Vibrio sp. YMD68]|uniref:hypothetical protein n=1 Tax=Vibrio sp. YMD68 TaxID=3042300 RepID=UPI00249C1F66|nr:hypothetical protein [Vibrio sp. YMD68]WGW01360.1 hypothetical protein QF117_11260 [Vibrio sp. YMD68]
MFNFQEFTSNICADDKESAIEFIQDFSNQFTRICVYVESILKSTKHDKNLIAAEELHKIVGASGLMGFIELAHSLRAFEDELKRVKYVESDFCHRLNELRESYQSAASQFSKTDSLPMHQH